MRHGRDHTRFGLPPTALLLSLVPLFLLAHAPPSFGQRGTVVGRVIDDPGIPFDDPFDPYDDPSRITPPEVGNAPVYDQIQLILAFPSTTVAGRSSRRPELVPGGAAIEEATLVHLKSRGGIGGHALELQAFGGARFEGAVVVEPVRLDARIVRHVEERLVRSAGAPAVIQLDAYCLEISKPAPSEGTVYRIAPIEVQRRHRAAARVLGAARAIRERGLLSPDSDPESYFHSIAQWSIWAWQNDLEFDSFEEAFLDKSRDLVLGAGHAWTSQVEETVRALVPNRWNDIRAILDLAGAPTAPRADTRS